MMHLVRNGTRRELVPACNECRSTILGDCFEQGSTLLCEECSQRCSCGVARVPLGGRCDDCLREIERHTRRVLFCAERLRVAESDRWRRFWAGAMRLSAEEAFDAT